MIETPEIPHHHHAPAPGHPSHWFERLLALAVLAMTALSLWVTLHSGRTMEQLVEQNARLVRAQSTPLLQFGSGNVSDAGKRELSFSVTNGGTGPARVVWLELNVGGHPAANAKDIVDTVGAGYRQIFSSPIAPALLKTGEERTLFRWPRPAAGDTQSLAAWQRLDQVRLGAAGVRARAYYCSLLDQCWLGDLSGAMPKAVEDCGGSHAPSYRG